MSSENKLIAISISLWLCMQVAFADTGYCEIEKDYWQCDDKIDFYYKFIDDFIPIGAGEIEVYPTPWISGLDDYGISQLRMTEEGKTSATLISPEKGKFDLKMDLLYKENKGKYRYELTNGIQLYVWNFTEKNCQGITDLYSSIVKQDIKRLLNTSKEKFSDGEEVIAKSGEPIFTIFVRGSSASAEILADSQHSLGKWALQLESTLRNCSKNIEPTTLNRGQYLNQKMSH